MSVFTVFHFHNVLIRGICSWRHYRVPSLAVRSAYEAGREECAAVTGPRYLSGPPLPLHCWVFFHSLHCSTAVRKIPRKPTGI